MTAKLVQQHRPGFALIAKNFQRIFHGRERVIDVGLDQLAIDEVVER